MTRSKATSRLLYVLAGIPFLPLLLLCACWEGASQQEPEPVAAEAPPARVAQAWFEYERDLHDFGTIYPGAVRSTRFELVAKGEEDIIVDDMTHSCGCTDGTLWVRAADGSFEAAEMGRGYPPGTVFELEAILSTKGRMDKQQQYVRLLQRDRKDDLRFDLAAMIEPYLVFEPAIIDVDRVTTLAGGSGSSEVSSANGKAFHLDCKRQYLPEEVELEFEPIEPDADGRAARWTVNAQLRRGVERGLQRFKIILVTDATHEQALPDAQGELPVHLGELWITAQVQGVMQAQPAQLALGSVQAGTPRTGRVLVRNRDPEFDFESIELGLFGDRKLESPFALSEAFELEAEVIEPGRLWEVRMTARGLRHEGSFGGVLAIKVDHPLEEMLTVPFSGTAAGAPN